MSAADVLGDLLGEASGIAAGYVGGGITVAVKTNYTPEITVYSGSADGGKASAAPGSGAAAPSAGLGGALSQLAGVQVGVVVKDAQGRVLAHYGPADGEPATDWVRVGALLGLVGLIGMGLVMLVRRL